MTLLYIIQDYVDAFYSQSISMTMSGYPKQNPLPNLSHTSPTYSQVTTANMQNKEKKTITSVLSAASKEVLTTKEVKTAKNYLTGKKPKQQISGAFKTASSFLDNASKNICGTQPTMVNGQPIEATIVKLFKQVDTDNTGRIDKVKLEKALQVGMQVNFSHETCSKLIKFYDQSGSESVNVNEFQQLYQMVTTWKQVFDLHDVDKSKDLNECELQKAFRYLNHNLSPTFIQSLLTKQNPSTKKLTLEKFIFVSFEVKRLTERFHARDPNRTGKVTMKYEEFVGVALDIIL